MQQAVPAEQVYLVLRMYVLLFFKCVFHTSTVFQIYVNTAVITIKGVIKKCGIWSELSFLSYSCLKPQPVSNWSPSLLPISSHFHLFSQEPGLVSYSFTVSHMCPFFSLCHPALALITPPLMGTRAAHLVTRPESRASFPLPPSTSSYWPTRVLGVKIFRASSLLNLISHLLYSVA